MLVLQMTAALAANPPTELTIISVADEAGTVTLSGQVSNPTLRAMAEEIAAGYPGVSHTVNELDVVPPERAQDE
jgi:osmotically-inducible protein OsmY